MESAYSFPRMTVSVVENNQNEGDGITKPTLLITRFFSLNQLRQTTAFPVTNCTLCLSGDKPQGGVLCICDRGHSKDAIKDLMNGIRTESSSTFLNTSPK